MATTSTQDATPADPTSAKEAAGPSAFPQFAVAMANQQIMKIGDTLIGAADSLDHMIAGSDLPLGEDLRKFATDATDRLRNAGTSINGQDAAVLLTGIQRSAAAQPALSIAVGATIGAVLAFAFLRTAPAQPEAGAA